MKLLLHVCCGPCAVYPVRILRERDLTVMGFFYPHNIHPYTECLKRKETLQAYAEAVDLKVIHGRGYDLTGFLQNVAFRETHRCRFCYHDRLRTTALMARRGKFDAFSTTLLYSKFQNHEAVRSIGESVGQSVGIPFHYEDFRPGWKEGIETSKEMGLYRQPYCGCIFSEKERYCKEPPRTDGPDGDTYRP